MCGAQFRVASQHRQRLLSVPANPRRPMTIRFDFVSAHETRCQRFVAVILPIRSNTSPTATTVNECVVATAGQIRIENSTTAQAAHPYTRAAVLEIQGESTRLLETSPLHHASRLSGSTNRQRSVSQVLDRVGLGRMRSTNLLDTGRGLAVSAQQGAHASELKDIQPPTSHHRTLCRLAKPTV